MTTVGFVRIEGKSIVITGGAGFIGSNMVAALVGSASSVVAFDNLSSGRYKLIKEFVGRKGFRFIKGDLLRPRLFDSVLRSAKPDLVIHFAANPDIRLGTLDTGLDIRQGEIATHNVLEACRHNDVESVMFSSSSAVYGEATVKPTPESYGPLKPISLYGASKLACEGLITAYQSLYGLDYLIYRFANVVGRNQTHGVMVDFIKKLGRNRRSLKVLGNGRQRKAYIDVADCCGAMLQAYELGAKNTVLNLATEGQTSVDWIARMVIARLAPGARISHTGTPRGWPGDIADTYISNANMKKLGVKLRLIDSDAAAANAIDTLCARGGLIV